MMANHIIDQKYNWLFGKGHLVICGDLFDLGKKVPEYLWLLYKLEHEAKAAGGYVHTILGNHDIMNLSGDLRYVQPKYFESAKALGVDYMRLYDENTELGRWLRTKNVVEKIGDELFLHGGISPEVTKAGLSVEKINSLCRPYYATKTSLVPEEVKLLFGDSSPFWYRGYFNDPLISSSDLDASLVHFGVKRIVVGHTITENNVGFRFGGKVLALDVNQHEGKHEAALYEKGNWYNVDAAGSKAKLSGRHVVPISIDGLRPEFYKDASWPAPHLQALMKTGTYADHALSVFPSYTYPSHSSMVTGAYPATHQVCFNVPFNPASDAQDWNWETSRIKAPTIWDAAKAAGLKTAIVQWPVSVGAPVNWNIPEIWQAGDENDDRIKESRKHAVPAGIVEELERNATGKLDGNNMSENFLSMDANSARMAAYLFKTYQPDLLALHFAHTDGAEHEHGRESAELREALSATDFGIGQVLEAIERSGLKDSTTVIIVGDHGFSDYNKVIFPNKWLADAGLFKKGATGWGCQFYAAGGSTFLYTENENDVELIAKVRALLESVPAEYRKLFKVLDKAELVKKGADRRAMLALTTVPGYVFGNNNQKVMAEFEGIAGHHGYDPDSPEMYTGFIASGAGIGKAGRIASLCVTDIAPIVMKLLGVEFKCPDGKVPHGLLIGK
jgi:predicted AlkP superfamily pyrophosphatase or phosphodiesterase